MGESTKIICKLSPVSFGRANAMKFAHRILISTIKKGEIWLILHDDISVLRSIFPSPRGEGKYEQWAKCQIVLFVKSSMEMFIIARLFHFLLFQCDPCVAQLSVRALALFYNVMSRHILYVSLPLYGK